MEDSFDFSGSFEGDQSISTANGQDPSYQTSEGQQDQSPNSCRKVLTQEEFHSLIKTVQLLRISQLRYIVQKYSIPASGNKTKLLGLVIQVFHNLMMDPILVDILHDINELLAQQDAPFATPQLTTGTIERCENNADYVTPFNPTINLNTSKYIFGPLLAKPGRSSGSFKFTTPPNEGDSPSTLITFMFYGGNPQPISLSLDLNGIPFEVFKDDPFPSPIDISNVISPPGIENRMEIKSLNTAVPFMIQVCQYEYVGLRLCIQQLCNGIDITTETPMVRTKSCTHPEPFSLVSFMSDALSTGKWICPVCGCPAQMQSLVFMESIPNKVQQQPAMPPQDQQQQPTMPNQPGNAQAIPSFQAESIFSQTPDLFTCPTNIDHFDWDAF